MCVIVHVPPTVEISKNTLEKCWKANPNGAGLMYATRGALVVRKGMMVFKDFYDEFLEARKANVDIVAHFRLASCGLIVPQQTHPFFVTEDLAFVHNGHFMKNTQSLPGSVEQSDTSIFCEQVLRHLPDDFLKNPGILTLIREYTDRSILVFLDADGKITILGDEDAGTLKDGCWFSNKMWDNFGGSGYFVNDGNGFNFEDSDEEGGKRGKKKKYIAQD